MDPQLRIFTTPEIMAEALAEEFFRYANTVFQSYQNIYIAVSGGNTPLLYFKKLAEYNQQRKNKIDWKRVHFFWVDERCVSPNDEESNYGNARKVLLEPIDIPEKNIHRMMGEAEPAEEARRYAELLLKTVPSKGGVPVFDWILLGLGEDGHTASIFPNQMKLMTSDGLCAVAEHPISKQKRITLTGVVLNLAKRITFTVTGAHKCEVVRQIIQKEPAAAKYPAYKVKPQKGTVDWYLDAKAADDI